MPLGLAEGFHAGGLYFLLLVGVAIALIVGIGALSHQRERAFSASVFYVLLGAVGAAAMALLDVDPLDPIADHAFVERLTELALMVAVFAAGLTVERKFRRASVVSVLVLLLIVMPLTIAAIAAFGYYAMGMSFAGAVLLGAVLAPTDPVLAGDVGLGPPGSAPQGEPRFSLHTEAAINDGLASPFVVAGLFIATDGGTGWIGEWVLADVIYGVGVAVAIGVALGWGAAWAMTRLRERGLVARDLDAFSAIALVLLIYGVCELIGTYGLLALFTAGFCFRRYEFEHEIHHRFHSGAETAGTLLELAVLLVLGSMLTTQGLGIPGWEGWLLAPLLILVIRPVLVMGTASSSLAPFRARLFLAFFGVRGVAALFYAAIVAGSGVLSPAENEVVVWTTIVCVVVSIIVHGTSQTTLTRMLLDRRE